MKRYDFAVIGAGVFGAWTTRFLRRTGASVMLLDAYGPAGSRASSSGETRVLRMGYGPDELYTRWALRSLPLWLEFEERAVRKFFHRTGVLWLSNDADPYLRSLNDVLGRAGVKRESLTSAELTRRWPQLYFPDVGWGVLEPESGLLMARSSVQALVADLVKDGVVYQTAAVAAPKGHGRLAAIQVDSGDPVAAGVFVFACGPWLPKVFPGLLGDRIFPSRQEVFYLGSPPGSDAFRPPEMPVWLHRTHPDLPYVLPDIENRGLKIAFDRHGEPFDPDSGSRVVAAASIERLRAYVERHIPALAKSPIVETRVCQYENTWNGDFLIDRHPHLENVWLVGGGSGHGFKHAPALGEYVAGLILNGGPAEPRFALDAKQAVQNRSIY